MRRTPEGPVAVAVTGGIGSGKSTFCRLVRRYPGVAHTDADRIVRGLLIGNRDVARAIAEAFGRDLLSSRGSVDRSRLAGKVFTNRRRLRRLERILHPIVRDRLAERVAALKRREGVAIVLVEIPLLVESGIPEWCDLVVTVEATEAVRLERLARRGLLPSEARRRMERQAGDADRRRVADVVIRNDGDRSGLEQGARRFWERLFSRTPDARMR